jgi:Gti1/Pac2 family transcription factor
VRELISCFVNLTNGSKVAYFTEASLDRLRSVDDFPQLASISVPNGKYRSARSAKGRPDHLFSHGDSPEFPRLEYISYNPTRSPSVPPMDSASRGRLPRPNTSTLSSPEPRSRRSHSGSASSDEGSDGLAPLEYLENLAPPRRHPIDEKTLMLFTSSRMI